MASIRSMSLKTSWPLVLTGMLLALFLVSCGQTGDRHTNISSGAANNFSSPLPARLQKLRPGLTAKVIVDGGKPSARTIDLQIDTQNDRVQGTIPDLPVGSHTFEIQYFIDGVLVATATVTANIQADVATPVPFDASSLVYPDTDGDGATNLNEVEIFGSGSNAWNDAATKPTVSVIVNPDAAILPVNGVQTFTAAIAQNANQAVTWSVQEPTGGSINTSGSYTAPATPGTFHVVATSQADPSKSATLPVTVINPGALDTTSFGTTGTGGTAFTPIGTSSFGQAVAIQSDGKILVVGQSTHFTLVRYNPDGTLDKTSFGPTVSPGVTSGIVTTPIGTSSTARAIAIQHDGKIVVAGQFFNGTTTHFALVRYNADGTLDTTSFGPTVSPGVTSGIVTTPIGASSFAFDVAIQPDGKIVAAGQSTNTAIPAITSFALVRYNSNGTLDNAPSSFGTGGIVTIPIGTGSSFGRAMALQSDGKIIIAGQANNASGAHFTLARYNSNGTLDTTSFGPTVSPGVTSGIVTTPIGTSSFATDLVLQPDGKIITVGNSTSGTSTTLTLVRYNADGSLDTTSFGTAGTGGIVATTIASGITSRQAVALQADGKTVVSGPPTFTVTRYNSNGTLDTTSFGPTISPGVTSGIVSTTIGTASLALDLALQSDGNIVIAGQSTNATLGTHFTVARYLADSAPVLLRANLTGDQEVPPVATTATGTAFLTLNPGQTEITYTLTVPVSDLNKITGVQIHLGTPGVAGRPLFTLTTSTFVSPLTGKLTAANLDPTATLAGINTFSDAIKAMLAGNTNIHIHTSANQSGEIRGQIQVAPPTLTSLQAQIFTPKCALCHVTGGTGSATANLFLDSAQTSFDNLVNVPSTEAPSLKRVEPGNPDASYLIHKLEGTAAPEGGRCCPDRMPASGPPFLSDQEVKKVRDWISDGAKNN